MPLTDKTFCTGAKVPYGARGVNCTANRCKVPLVRKTGRRRPVLPFGDTETPDPDAPLAIFQTVSLGNPMNKPLAYAPIRKCPEAGRVVHKGVQVDHSA